MVQLKNCLHICMAHTEADKLGQSQQSSAGMANKPPEGCGSSHLLQGQSCWWVLLCALSWEQVISYGEQYKNCIPHSAKLSQQSETEA